MELMLECAIRIDRHGGQHRCGGMKGLFLVVSTSPWFYDIWGNLWCQGEHMNSIQWVPAIKINLGQWNCESAAVLCQLVTQILSEAIIKLGAEFTWCHSGEWRPCFNSVWFKLENLRTHLHCLASSINMSGEWMWQQSLSTAKYVLNFHKCLCSLLALETGKIPVQ